MKINKDIRREIFDYILSVPTPFLGIYAGYDNYNDVTIVDFLKLIWDLAAMPSEDSRFKNAEADAYQHLVNNDDWDVDYTFLTRFNLLRESDGIFVKFIEAVVSPEVRNSDEEIKEYVGGINPILSKSGHKLYVVDVIDNHPIYRVKEGLNHYDYVQDESDNDYVIYVDEEPKSFPSFVLKEDTWDDYGRKTRYGLWFYEKAESCYKIGRVKIMNGDESVTYKTLLSGVKSFGPQICSLGQDISYYKEIKQRLGNQYKSFLLAMRDAAFSTKICDEFKEHNTFKISLLRESLADRALNAAKYVLAGYSEDESFDFVFRASLPYSSEALNVRFNFGRIDDDINMNRMIALIGDNGVGKTTILKQLAESIVHDSRDKFSPHMPLFSKVITISFSIFDRFYEIKSPSHFNYVYCGFHKENATILTEKEISERRKCSLQLLGEMGRVRIFNKFLKEVIDAQLLEEIWAEDKWELFDDRYNDLCSKMSSGQSLLFHLAAEIISNIRENALILIDEPEVHLHPKAITQIMNMLSHICEKFSSCCIMATHSPIVIQNILSRNVIIIGKTEAGEPEVRRMHIESLGDNLATITEDIFGRYSTRPFYIDKIEDLVERHNNDWESVLMEIQNGEVPLNFALHMLISHIMDRND